MCLGVCLCVCLRAVTSPCWCILHTNIALLSRVNIYSSSSSAKSLCHNALASLSPSSSSSPPPLALLLLPAPPPPSLPHPPSRPPVTSTVRFSAAEHDQGQLRRPLSMRGHPVEAIHYRQLVPNHLSPPAICVCPPAHPPTSTTLSHCLSIAGARTACSNSFLTQLLRPIGMWLDVVLMACHSFLCIEAFFPLPPLAYSRGCSRGCLIPNLCFISNRGYFLCAASRTTGCGSGDQTR